MSDILIFMAPTICMCIILVGICGYVGIHVIMREVIFIDIALAQVAALGVSFGLFLGFEFSDTSIIFVSLLFTLFTALLLSISQRLGHIVPQEAFIGILVTFAVRVAGVLLVFGFLIVPAAIGSLLGKSFNSRLIIGWITGVLVSLIGSYLSYILDFPTGGMVVVTLGFGLLFVALIKGMQLKFKSP